MKLPIYFLTALLLMFKINFCSAYIEDFQADDEIIVTATKVATSQTEVGTIFTVIGEEQIQKIGKKDVLSILRTTQGLNISQTGSFGGAASVYLRGTDPGHTLVLVDGIEVNDPMSIERAYDFSHLTTDNVERIEIIRGAQSTLYGSDAIGGVVNIITKKGTKIPEISLLFEYGSDDTYKESVAVRGKKDKLGYSASISRLDTAGISKTQNGQEKDPYRNTTMSLNFDYDISDMAMINLIARYIDAETEIDDSVTVDDPNRFSEWKDFASKLSFVYQANDYWEQIFSYSFAEIYRRDPDRPDNISADASEYIYKGYNEKFEWQHNIFTEYFDTTTFGLEYEKESGRQSESTPAFDKKSIINRSCYFQNQFKFFDSLFITPGIRLDNHEKYGTEATYKVSALYNIDKTDTTLKANYGTGIKSPSIYQLFSSIGSEDLNAEKSKSYDFGFEQRFFSKKAFFSLIYFYNEIDDLIDYVWTGPGWFDGNYQNVDKVEIYGHEASVKYEIIKGLVFGMDFCYLKTRDKATNLELLKRPRRKMNFNIDWKFAKKHNLHCNINFVSKRKDRDWLVGNVDLDEYCTVDLNYLYDLTDDFQLCFRIENLFDEDYEEVYGYKTKGTSYYASGRLKI